MCKGQGGSFSEMFSSGGSRNVRNRSSSSFSHTVVSSLMMGGGFFDFRLGNYFCFLRARGFVGCVRLRGAGTPSDMLKRLNAAMRVRCAYMTHNHQSTFNMSFLFLTPYQNVLFFLVPGLHQMKQLVIRQRQSTLDKRVQILERTGRP